MTVKQAYEIFFGPIPETEITEEFIRTSILESSLKERKNMILRNYNQQTLKIRKELNPNNQILNIINIEENLNKITNEIKQAYEILRKCITIHNFKHDGFEENLLFPKYDKYLAEEKHQKTVKERKAIETAANIYYYHIDSEIKELTEEALKSITWELPIPEISRKTNEYQTKNKEQLNKIKNKREQQRLYLELQEKTEFRNQDLKHIQKILAEDYYQEIISDDANKKAVLWLKENAIYFREQRQKDHSEINNLNSKVMQRLKNAKELYISIITNQCIDFVENSMNKIDDPKVSELEKIRIANECQKLIIKTNKLIEECEEKYKHYFDKISAHKNKTFTKKDLEILERMVQKLITPEYLKYLNQNSLDENKEKVEQRQSSYQQNCSKIEKIEKNGKKQLINQIIKNQKYLKKIDNKIQGLTLLELNKLSNEKLIECHQTLKKETKETLKRVIKNHFEIILIETQIEILEFKENYHKGNISGNAQIQLEELMNKEYKHYNMYITAMNSNNFKELDEIYTEFHQITLNLEVNPIDIEEDESKIRHIMINDIIKKLKEEFQIKGASESKKVEIFKGREPITIEKIEIPANISQRFKKLRNSEPLDLNGTIELEREIKELSTIEIYELLNELTTYIFNKHFAKKIELDDSEKSKKR